MPTLTSKWGSLNPNLIASFYPVEHRYETSGDYWARSVGDAGAIDVAAPLSECNVDASLQWNSPFEAIGAESKFPLINGLLQSGALNSALSALSYITPQDIQQDFTSASATFNGSSPSQRLQDLENVAGITRLNSTQIFSGMQPMKFTATAHFRAWDNPIAEVRDPVSQLMQWALPQKLSKAGFFEGFAKSENLIRSLFPSRSPQILGFSYGGATVLPVVIESIQQSLVGPRDVDGNRISVALQLTFSTLAAIDKDDWKTYGFR